MDTRAMNTKLTELYRLTAHLEDLVDAAEEMEQKLYGFDQQNGKDFTLSPGTKKRIVKINEHASLVFCDLYDLKTDVEEAYADLEYDLDDI